MKINVQVDLTDFYQEDEDAGSFNDQIKDHIAYQVKNEVMKDFREKAFEEIKKTTSSQIELSWSNNIESIVSEIIKSKKLKKSESKNSTELATIEEFIQERIEEKYFSPDSTLDNLLFRKIQGFEQKVVDEISKRSESISKELKDRYDMLFASQIVHNLNKQGMLKDDIAKLLLTENK